MPRMLRSEPRLRAWCTAEPGPMPMQCRLWVPALRRTGLGPGSMSCEAIATAVGRAHARIAGMERYRWHSASRLCLATGYVAGCSGRDRFRRRGLETDGRSIERSVCVVHQIERPVPNFLTNLSIVPAP